MRKKIMAFIVALGLALGVGMFVNTSPASASGPVGIFWSSHLSCGNVDMQPQYQRAGTNGTSFRWTRVAWSGNHSINHLNIKQKYDTTAVGQQAFDYPGSLSGNIPTNFGYLVPGSGRVLLVVTLYFNDGSSCFQTWGGS